MITEYINITLTISFIYFLKLVVASKKRVKNMKKAQISIEFIIIFTCLLLFFVVFTTLIQKNINEKEMEKEKIILQNIALNIQYEINFAGESSEGYLRNFEIPQNVFGKDYNLTHSDDKIYLYTRESWFSYKVANFTGTLHKGMNVIKRENETIFVN